MATPDYRYPRLVVALHSLTAVAVFIAYFLSEGGPGIKADPPHLHFMIGAAVLLLTLPRIMARVVAPPVPPIAGNPPLLSLAAKAGHLALYALLIAVPLTGWYTLSRVGIPFNVFGLTIPALTSAVEGPPGPIGELHELGGNALLILGIAHGLVAAWHQFVKKDGVMNRMTMK